MTGAVPAPSSRARRSVTGLDNSRYGAAATAAPVLTASARPRPVPGLSSRGAWPRRTSRLLAFRKGGSLRKSWVETSKVFAQAFFKRLVGFGVKPQDLTGVRGRSHRLPILQKRGDGCPPLGTAQNPLPQGLREGNEHLREKPSVYAGLRTCSGEQVAGLILVKMLM